MSSVVEDRLKLLLGIGRHSIAKIDVFNYPTNTNISILGL